MKKRNLILLVSLFSLSSISFISCDNTRDSDDEMFEEPSSEQLVENITLKEYKEDNYVLDPNSSNEFGSMSYEIFVRSFYDADGDDGH